jgi:3-phosphoshikimate 1-carboxyvinyltransferase
LKLQLTPPQNKLISQTIAVTGSKSETNRLLLLRALFPNISLENLSNSDDGAVMKKGLMVNEGTVDIHHAGTAMRFLTAWFATQKGKDVLLTGSHRMKERPIKVLVDALRQLGAKIEYAEEEGFPPLKISGKKLTKNYVSLPANISSQYISALLLVAPSLEKGLELELVGKITSVPYIKMTLGLLAQIGVSATFEGNHIKVLPEEKVMSKNIVVESDWSSASYFYSLTALSEVGSQITLSAYKADSLQGDSVLKELYRDFGVNTSFNDHHMTLTKVAVEVPQNVEYNLANAPDIAQTIAVTCFGLGVGCKLTGLHTLPIKETDRLDAMKTELSKLGGQVIIDHESLALEPRKQWNENVAIDTYHDHRMAMAFAPLALMSSLVINDAGVVSKSYPDFWKDIVSIGISATEF